MNVVLWEIVLNNLTINYYENKKQITPTLMHFRVFLCREKANSGFRISVCVFQPQISFTILWDPSQPACFVLAFLSESNAEDWEMFLPPKITLISNSYQALPPLTCYITGEGPDGREAFIHLSRLRVRPDGVPAGDLRFTEAASPLRLLTSLAAMKRDEGGIRICMFTSGP